MCAVQGVGKDLDKAAENIGNAAKDAADNVKDSAKDAEGKVEDAAGDVSNKVCPTSSSSCTWNTNGLLSVLHGHKRTGT